MNQGVKTKRIRILILSILLPLFMIGAVYSLVSVPVDSTASAKILANTAQLDPLVPSTPRDFILPGTQPNDSIHLLPPGNCASCHAGYAYLTDQPSDTETWTAWAGSMMAQAGRDPLFFAALDVANADAAFSGEFCLRCHMPRGWLNGRSSETDGSSMTDQDREGVQCAVCHRMVDPEYSSENPDRDVQILDDLDGPVPFIGSSSMVIDPEDFRRGPFDIVTDLTASIPILRQGLKAHWSHHITKKQHSVAPVTTSTILCSLGMKQARNTSLILWINRVIR